MSSRKIEPIEITEIADFLGVTPPFDGLDESTVRTAARTVDITYERSGTVMLDLGDATDTLYLVRSGAVELHDASDTLIARLGEHEFFGYPSLLTDAPARRRVTAIEDTLVYHLPASLFDRLRAQHAPFDRFFARAHADRIHDAVQESRANVPLTTSLRDVISRRPVQTAPDTSIRDAAAIMQEHRVSSLLITDNSQLVGLVTDRDLRNRVLAAGVAPAEPVSAVMTDEPWTIASDARAFEAMLTMSRRNIHHLPVVDHDGVVGMVTTTDLIRQQVDSPVYLVGEVWKQEDLDGLIEVSRRVPGMLRQVVDAGARADDAARMVTAVTDALTERLIELAIDRLGPPPAAFAWVALGSQARHEQTAHSDQDNALVLGNDAAQEDDAYFKEMAQFVCDGLNACGYEYCPGEVMATTHRWRQPLSEWKRTFRGWIEEPRPKSLMHATIFFDVRHIAGNPALTAELQSFVLDRTARNTIFLASLAATALDNEPPLGFFRRFVLERHGGEKDTLDLKLNGVVPIVDLARIHALGHGVPAVNTLERFQQLATAGHMNAGDAADLRDAHEFIASVRLRHQVDQIRRDREPDNFVAPDSLSGFERRHLKDAFKIVSQMQKALAQRYQTSFIS